MLWLWLFTKRKFHVSLDDCWFAPAQTSGGHKCREPYNTISYHTIPYRNVPCHQIISWFEGCAHAL